MDAGPACDGGPRRCRRRSTRWAGRRRTLPSRRSTRRQRLAGDWCRLRVGDAASSARIASAWPSTPTITASQRAGERRGRARSQPGAAGAAAPRGAGAASAGARGERAHALAQLCGRGDLARPSARRAARRCGARGRPPRPRRAAAPRGGRVRSGQTCSCDSTSAASRARARESRVVQAVGVISSRRAASPASSSSRTRSAMTSRSAALSRPRPVSSAAE